MTLQQKSWLRLLDMSLGDLVGMGKIEYEFHDDGYLYIRMSPNLKLTKKSAKPFTLRLKQRNSEINSFVTMLEESKDDGMLVGLSWSRITSPKISLN